FALRDALLELLDVRGFLDRLVRRRNRMLAVRPSPSVDKPDRYVVLAHRITPSHIHELERQRLAVVADCHRPTMLQLPEEDLVGEAIADFRLDHPRERPRAKHRVVALLREVLPRTAL